MSIGKSSIARAVNVTKDTPQEVKKENKNIIVQKFGVQEISLLKDATDLSLLESVKKHGVLCPVLVAITDKGDKWLIDGYSRIAAAKELGSTDIDAVVINVGNKNDVNRLYKELLSLKPKTADNIHEEKFKVLAVKDHDLPAYLL
ncbi:MAG: ParB/Srx family N-terminal domain-containing protein [Clostridia bacterium]|nr:ParB/Srx family N-terminal domain-containing protein [Clostridia bacterium]